MTNDSLYPDKVRLSRLKARRTILRKELARFEEIERHVVCHTPKGDKWAANRTATFLEGIAKLTRILGI